MCHVMTTVWCLYTSSDSFVTCSQQGRMLVERGITVVSKYNKRGNERVWLCMGIQLIIDSESIGDKRLQGQPWHSLVL